MGTNDTEASVSESAQGAQLDGRMRAVIAAAVGMYLQGEEEACVEAALPQAVVAEGAVRPWSLSGRLSQMEQRFSMQMRAFR